MDRVTAHVSDLHLPDFDPALSDVVWFRDEAAYCGLPGTGKHLYAVVAELGVRRPVMTKMLAPWDAEKSATPACAPATWQREPLQVTFHPTGAAAITYALFGRSSAIVDDEPAEE